MAIPNFIRRLFVKIVLGEPSWEGLSEQERRQLMRRNARAQKRLARVRANDTVVNLLNPGEDRTNVGGFSESASGASAADVGMFVFREDRIDIRDENTRHPEGRDRNN